MGFNSGFKGLIFMYNTFTKLCKMGMICVKMQVVVCNFLGISSTFYNCGISKVVF